MCFLSICMESVLEGLGVYTGVSDISCNTWALLMGFEEPSSLQHHSVLPSALQGERYAQVLCVRVLPFLLLPNYIPHFYVKSNIASLPLFFPQQLHQEYPITFINTCFKNITVVSCCFKFWRAMRILDSYKSFKQFIFYQQSVLFVNP